MIRRTLAAIGLLALLTTGCSSDNKVGQDDLLNFKEKSPGAFDADPSPSKSPAVKTTKASAAPVASRTSRPSPPAKASPKPAADPIALTITINSDTGGQSQFDPSAARIYQGTCVQWKNADRVARSVVADANAFSSGPIPAGGTYTYCPKAAGKFNYHDGTRPYAVASLEVLAR
jgi:plastocyanin